MGGTSPTDHLPVCRWYLRYFPSYRVLKEIMAERNLSVDHFTIGCWAQRYSPLLNQRMRREMRQPYRSWRVDETYLKVAGNWTYLYRPVDSCGDTIDFMLSPKRDLIAAKLFLRLALFGSGTSQRVLNVEGQPAYASAFAELKQSRELGRRCRRRTAPYLNNIIESDHPFIKKRITASVGFRSAEAACRTIEGYEALHAIRKGQIRWVGENDPLAQRQFSHTIFGIVTLSRSPGEFRAQSPRVPHGAPCGRSMENGFCLLARRQAKVRA